MKEFDPAQIESTRNFFEQNFSKESTDFNGEEFEYFVIPQEMNPDLPDFALRLTHTDPKTREVEGVYGVSNSVPENIRPYYALHEIIEFGQIGIDERGRCASAEREVLQKMPADLMDEYIERRIGFFKDLILFFQNKIQEGEQDYDKDDIEEAKGTLQLLEETRG